MIKCESSLSSRSSPVKFGSDYSLNFSLFSFCTNLRKVTRPSRIDEVVSTASAHRHCRNRSVLPTAVRTEDGSLPGLGPTLRVVSREYDMHATSHRGSSLPFDNMKASTHTFYESYRRRGPTVRSDVVLLLRHVWLLNSNFGPHHTQLVEHSTYQRPRLSD